MSKELSKLLKKIRKAKEFSLREVEEITGISNSYLSQIERSTEKVPSIRTLSRLSEAYGYPLSKMADLVIGNKVYEFKVIPKYAEGTKQAANIQYIIRRYSQLTDNGKKQLLDYLSFLLKQEKKKEE